MEWSWQESGSFDCINTSIRAEEFEFWNAPEGIRGAKSIDKINECRATSQADMLAVIDPVFGFWINK